MKQLLKNYKINNMNILLHIIKRLIHLNKKKRSIAELKEIIQYLIHKLKNINEKEYNKESLFWRYAPILKGLWKMTETKIRSLIKSLTWRLLASTITGLIVLFLTNEKTHAIGAGLLDAVIKIIIYYCHACRRVARIAVVKEDRKRCSELVSEQVVTGPPVWKFLDVIDKLREMQQE